MGRQWNYDDELASGSPPRGRRGLQRPALGIWGGDRACRRFLHQLSAFRQMPQRRRIAAGRSYAAYFLRQQGASPSSPGYTARADELNRERSSAAGNQVVMILGPQCAFVGVLEETRDIGGSPSRSRCRHNATIMIDTSDEDNDTLSPGSSPHPRRGLQRSLKQGRDPRSGGYQAEGGDLRQRRRRDRRELARAEAPPALARRIRLRLLSSRGREQCGSSSALGWPGSGLGPRYHCR